MTTASLFLLGLAASCAAFAVVYALARRIDNYGIVDIAWAYGFGVVAAGYGWLADGWDSRRLIVSGLVIVWSLRLGSHLYRRVMGHHPVEDGRYKEMRQRWATNFNVKMFGFFQLQAVSLAVLSVPFLLASRNPAVGLHPAEIAGVCLWFVALLGESFADAQLEAFKRDPRHQGAVCDVGLWRYSRHPNYFFEWLVWVSYFLFALGSPWGWVSIFCPACILYLLLRVTGIPMTEEQSLRSRGDAYREYQRRTSAFIPWRPRRIEPKGGSGD